MNRKFKLEDNMYMKHHKIQLFPNQEQAEYIEKCINITRYVYNWALDIAIKQYELYQIDDENKSSFTKAEYGIMLTKLRKDPEHAFLLEIPHITERMAIWNMIRSMDRYFRGLSNKPGFKCKKDLTTCKFKTRYDRTYFVNNCLKIEGIDSLIKTNYKTNYTLHKENPAIYNPVITRDKFGKYWFTYDTKEPIPPKPKEYGELGRALGIDLNIKKRFALSDGSYYLGPDLDRDFFILKRYQRKMKKDILRRQKMEKTNPELYPIQKSNRSKKKQLKYAKQYKHITNKVETYIQMTVSDIIKKHPIAIVMENLDIHEITSDPVFAATIGHAHPNFYRCREVMQYKCKLNHIPFILAPKTFPSSKRCSVCGNILNRKLKGHEYICDCCNSRIDRDLNAAINLERLAYIPKPELINMGCVCV